MGQLPRLTLGAIALTFAFVSCSKGPTSPSSALGVLQLVVPPEIEPGQAVGLTAHIAKPDGFSVDVTSQAQWTVQSAGAGTVLDVTATGLATARDRGRALLTVRYRDLTADATILVLPKRTFTLKGRISAAGAGLANVAITVIAGVGEGLATRTSSSGDYELFGVAGEVQVRASHEGYFDRALAAAVYTHSSLSFELANSRPKDDHAGFYTLIVTGGSCAPGFPEEAKQRAYTARVEQTGAHVHVSLSTPQFTVGGFGGQITAPGEIRFTVRAVFGWEDYVVDWVDRLSDGSRLFVSGSIIAKSTPAGISGSGNSDLGGASLTVTDSNLLSQGQSCSMDRFELLQQ